MNPVIIGTAGHIDHGKSTLVKVLTGTDPDRLPEEKRRQITIDLGYAFLSDGAAIIDVPGHEKFIRNMVAGASTVDFAILVIAADDGVMPQTREHLQILNFLSVRHGCIAVSKCSLATPERLAEVEQQIREETKATFLQNAHLFFVDSLSGQGIDDFRRYLLDTVSKISRRPDLGVFRLPIDRVFSIKGHGIVVTGTVLSGSAKIGDRLELLPSGKSIRVKRIESQGTERETVGAGRRVALNIVGELDGLDRGQSLVTPNGFRASSRIRVAVELLPGMDELRDRQRIRLLIGTQECIGRVQIIGRRDDKIYADLSLETPAVVAWDDRFILRCYSPMETLGGGRVLDPSSPLRGRRQRELDLDFCVGMDTDTILDTVKAYVESHADKALSLESLSAVFGSSPQYMQSLLSNTDGSIYVRSGFVLSSNAELVLKGNIICRLQELQRSKPTAQGFPLSELQSVKQLDLPETLLTAVLTRVEQEGVIRKIGSLFATSDFAPSLSESQQKLIDRLLTELRSDRFTPRSLSLLSEKTGIKPAELDRALALAEKFGLCKRLGTDLFFETSEFDRAVHAIQTLLASKKELSVSDVSTALNSSRKYVVPFLEYLDQHGITARNGNFRVAGRSLQNFVESNPS